MKKLMVGIIGVVVVLAAAYTFLWLRFAYVPAEYAEPMKQYEHAHELEAEGKVTEAIRWYRRAAHRGVAEAMLRMGMAHMDGSQTDGITLNVARAHPYFVSAAEHGNTQAMILAAIDFETGAGTPKDEKKALEWYVKAATEGNAVAMERLVKVYKDGELGEPKSTEKRQEWERLLAKAKQAGK